MYPNLEVTEEEVELKCSGSFRWLEISGLVLPRYVTKYTPSAEHFCDECSEQIEKNATTAARL